jgi:translation initiation factor 4A
VTLCAGVIQRLDYGSAQCQALIVVTADARPDVLDRESDRSTRPVPRCQGLHLHRRHECPRGPGNCESSRSAQVAIGTSGRVLDLLGRDALRRDHIRMLVLDEADELLTGGFKDQVN